MPSSVCVPRRLVVVLIVALGSLTACDKGDRPKLGNVVGAIRLDGKPLDNVRVIFKAPGSRAAVGATDENGEYYLIYLRDIKGAAVGEHQVKLFDMNMAEGDVGGGRIPAKYLNGTSPLNATVEAGEQTIDFDLSSAEN